MATASTNPDLLRVSSVSLTPFEYFTDVSNIVQNKADLVLIVGEQKFYCHRLLLSLISPVFTRMFDGEFKEHEQQPIVLHGKNSQSVLELLKNIYPQFDGEVNDENVEDFLQLADEYMIEHLKKPCEEFLEKQINQLKFVSLPIHYKNEKAKKETNVKSSPSSVRSNDETGVVRRRVVVSKSAAVIPKTAEKNSALTTSPSRSLILLNRNEIPTFFDAEHKSVPFTIENIEVWLRRLKILYRIHRGKNYGEIIDSILSVLQFIPSNIFYPLIKLSSENFATEEILLADLGRARMFFLEDWTSDGEINRKVVLTESYRTSHLSSSEDNHQVIDDGETRSVVLTTSVVSLPSDEIVTATDEE